MGSDKDFKEFENLPEGWKRVKLGDNTYFKIVGSGIDYFRGYKNYLSTNSVQGKKITHIEEIITFKNRPSRANMQPKKYRVAFAKMRNTTKVLLIDEKLEKDYILSTGFALLETTINPKFIYQYLLSPFFNKQKDIFAEGTTQEAISNDNFDKIYITFPELKPEQQKIAEILETVDNAIEKTDRIIEKYKRIKQGLMQDLLTKGIDENGNIRSEETHEFKDSPLGRIPEEWEVVRLGEVFNIRAGGDISRLSYFDTRDGKFKYPIFSNTLENKGLYGYSDTFTYPEGCITITGRGALGYAIPRFEKFNAIIRVLVLIPKFDVDIVFVSEYINCKVNFVIESTGVPQLTAPKVVEYYIPLPPLPEQQRIAEILSQLDQAIEKEQQYKEKLERLKQGLMEDLLTGKVRVNHLIKEGVKNVSTS